jgi:hypothetical protein
MASIVFREVLTIAPNGPLAARYSRGRGLRIARMPAMRTVYKEICQYLTV